MTERKPRGVSFESWVEKQIREARERGSFDALAGAGQPLPPTSSDELAWVRQKVEREGLPLTALLPPSLAVAKEAEDLPQLLARERSEERVRRLVEGLNARIDAARRGPALGPPVRTPLFDVEATVAAWREAQPAPVVAPPPPPPAPRARWWRRQR
ncbi:MAG: molecular chaperone DnaJ [Frankiales bacterium]|nr:molecular chaperone DnaJ [Frankiales bacterium]